MRSTTFDMTAMFLMALGVIFTCGVLLMIGYTKAARTRRPEAPSPGEPTGGASAQVDHDVRSGDEPQLVGGTDADAESRAPAHAGQH